MFPCFVTGAATEYASYTSSPYTQYTSSPYAGYSYSTTGTSGLLSRYFAYVVGFVPLPFPSTVTRPKDVKTRIVLWTLFDARGGFKWVWYNARVLSTTRILGCNYKKFEQAKIVFFFKRNTPKFEQRRFNSCIVILRVLGA